MSFAFAPDEKLNVYTGDFNVDVLVQPLRSVQPGKYIVRGSLKYQACDNTACYPPKNLPISFDVRIAGSKAHSEPGAEPARAPVARSEVRQRTTDRAWSSWLVSISIRACSTLRIDSIPSNCPHCPRSANAGNGDPPWWRALHRSRCPRRHLDGCGHDFAHRCRSRITVAERQPRRTSRSVKIPAIRWSLSTTATAPTCRSSIVGSPALPSHRWEPMPPPSHISRSFMSITFLPDRS